MQLATPLICALVSTLAASHAAAQVLPTFELQAPGVLVYGYDMTPGASDPVNLQSDERTAGTAFVSSTSATSHYWAQATLVDGLQLPQLRLYAEAHGNPARTYTNAGAGAWQDYAYTGTGDATYTLRLTFDGSWTGTNGGASARLMAGIGTLQTDGSQEVDFDAVPSLYLQAGADASPLQFTLTDTMTFTLQPGGSLSLLAKVDATAIPGRNGFSILDISHTVSLQFLAGDTALLTPAVSAVPEPGSWALLLAGLLTCALTGVPTAVPLPGRRTRRSTARCLAG
jgi:hypothetical protein